MDRLGKLVEGIKNARHLVVLTGAGVSNESGIPTFRGEDGLWKQYRAEELATPQAFRRNPQLVWEWYNYRRRIIRSAEPNPAHYTIAWFEGVLDKVTVITQNVDGLHKRAGSSRVVELHGNIFENYCFQCGKAFGDIKSDRVPVCDVCGGFVRPGVVWFGESLPTFALEEADSAISDADAVLVVGTSLLVAPASFYPFLALRDGKWVGEINLEPTQLTPIASVSIQGKAGEVLGTVRDVWEGHCVS